jgi:hypothetical protein
MRNPFRLTAILSLILLIGCSGGGPVAPPTSQTISASFTHQSRSDYTVNQTVFFDASASTDQLFKIVKYTWDWGDGSDPSISDNPGASHIFNNPKTYDIKLTITDQADREASSNQSIRIYYPGSAPIARFSYDAPNGWQPGCTIQFDASCSSDVNGDIVSYKWDWGDESSSEPSPMPTASHQFTNAGDYQITLSVQDSTGRIGTRTPMAFSFGYPTNPHQVTTFAPFLPEEYNNITSIAASNGYVYFSDVYDIIRVINGQDPANPMLLDPIVPMGHVFGLAASGDLLCARTYDLFLLGVSNPAKTDILGVLHDGPTGYPVLRNHLAFSWISNMFSIADIGNPFEPIFASAANNGEIDPYMYRLALTDNYAYVQSGKGLDVYDIRDPYSVKFLDKIKLQDVVVFPSIVAGSGHFIYSFDNVFDQATAKYRNLINAYDITQPTNPILKGTYNIELGTGTIDNATVIGHYAYVLYYADGKYLHIFDISNPEAIVPVSSAAVDVYGYSIILSGRYAYLTDGNSLGIVQLW